MFNKITLFDKNKSYGFSATYKCEKCEYKVEVDLQSGSDKYLFHIFCKKCNRPLEAIE